MLVEVNNDQIVQASVQHNIPLILHESDIVDSWFDEYVL